MEPRGGGLREARPREVEPRGGGACEARPREMVGPRGVALRDAGVTEGRPHGNAVRGGLQGIVRARTRAAVHPASPAPQRQQHRAERQHRPLLVGDRQAQHHTRPHRPVAAGERHRGDAQARAQQFLGVAQFQRAQRQRIGDAHPQRDRPCERRASARAHPRVYPHAEPGCRQQAWQRHRPVHRQRSAAPQPRRQRERSALHERAAVGRGELEKRDHVPLRERIQRRLDFVFVVVPAEPIQPQPCHRRARRRGRQRAQGVLADHPPHA